MMRAAGLSIALILAAPGLAWAQSGRAQQDLLLLRSFEIRQGALAECSRESCTFGGTRIARDAVTGIGLGGASIGELPVRLPIQRDEVHFRDRSVRPETMLTVDKARVVTDRGSYPRADVAWIFLGGAGQRAATRTPLAPEPAGIVPRRIFLWTPRACDSCEETLAVHELAVEGDAVVLKGSRSITIHRDGWRGHWFTYDPPPPLFPVALDAPTLALEVDAVTLVREEWFADQLVAESPSRGTTPPGGTARPGPALPGSAPRPAIEQWIGRQTGALRDALRDRIDRDRVQFRLATGRGGRHLDRADRIGVATVRLSLRVQNWRRHAGETIDRRSPQWNAYAPIRAGSVYDVGSRSDFHWLGYGLRQREVDTDGFTTDREVNGPPRRGTGRPAAGGGAAPPSGPATQRWLNRQMASVDDLTNRVLQDLVTWEDRRQGADGGPVEWAPAPTQERTLPATNHPGHSVALMFRWYRPDGRVSAQYGSDIIADVVDRRPLPLPYVYSVERPSGAFDVPAAPSWPPANPRPPEPAEPGSGPVRFIRP